MAKTIQKNIRFTAEEIERIEAHAAKMGVSFSEWVKNRAAEPPLPLEVWARIKEQADRHGNPFWMLIQRIVVLFDARDSAHKSVWGEQESEINQRGPTNLDEFWETVYQDEIRRNTDYRIEEIEEKITNLEELDDSDKAFLQRSFPRGYEQHLQEGDLTLDGAMRRAEKLQADGVIPIEVNLDQIADKLYYCVRYFIDGHYDRRQLVHSMYVLMNQSEEKYLELRVRKLLDEGTLPGNIDGLDLILTSFHLGHALAGFDMGECDANELTSEILLLIKRQRFEKEMDSEEAKLKEN